MGALVIPLLEVAAEAIAVGWSAFVSSGTATAVAGGAATAAILSIPSDKAEDKEDNKADTQVLLRTRKRECKCPPEKGHMGQVNHSMSELSAEYQAYITKFPRGMEWIFDGINFDGFVKAECLLQEAKAHYDFFFDQETGKPKKFFLNQKASNSEGLKNKSAWENILAQAKRQNATIVKHPPSKLKWYFMQMAFYEYATEEFAEKNFLS